MLEITDLFISEHAIKRFQQYIAPMNEMLARFFIGAGIQQALNRKLIPANAEHAVTWRIRTKRPFPFEFRAFCVFDLEKQCWVVKTIVRGDSCVKRQQKRRRNRRQEQPL
ncbi:MAG: hypothetical protein JST85_29290 [Acidobacteria bacterium]|nr:hypothetical protein [Acidobacteriota bacterium]